MAATKTVQKKPGVAVLEAWRELDALQCGFCQSEQIMSATAVLTKNPTPTDQEIDQGMGGNVCHCITADHIRDAVMRAATYLNAPKSGGA